MDTNINKKDIGEIILYQPDDSIRLEVRLREDNVWLNLNQMAGLFNRDKSVVSRHIKHIYEEGELQQDATVAKFATVPREGGKPTNRDPAGKGFHRGN